MPDLGLAVFDRAMQDADRYLDALTDEPALDDRQAAYHALRAVLFSLRDRLTTDLAAAFGAQLPLLVRGLYYEGYRPGDQPAGYRTLDEWNARVRDAFDGTDLAPEDASAAVFRTMNETLDPAVLVKVRAALPHDVRALWPEPAAEEA